jgi:hypothetical protein
MLVLWWDGLQYLWGKRNARAVPFDVECSRRLGIKKPPLVETEKVLLSRGLRRWKRPDNLCRPTGRGMGRPRYDGMETGVASRQERQRWIRFGARAGLQGNGESSEGAYRIE